MNDPQYDPQHMTYNVIIQNDAVMLKAIQDLRKRMDSLEQRRNRDAWFDLCVWVLLTILTFGLIEVQTKWFGILIASLFMVGCGIVLFLYLTSDN